MWFNIPDYNLLGLARFHKDLCEKMGFCQRYIRVCKVMISPIKGLILRGLQGIIEMKSKKLSVDHEDTNS